MISSSACMDHVQDCRPESASGLSDDIDSILKEYHIVETDTLPPAKQVILAMNGVNVILQGRFDFFSKGRSTFNICLTPNGLECYKPGKPKETLVYGLSDILGCHRLLQKGNTEFSSLAIYCYPKVKKSSGKTIRKRECLLLRLNRCSPEENQLIAEKWRLALSLLLNGVSIYDEHDILPELTPPKKNYLVLINPVSGQGKSMQLFSEWVAPMMAEADVTYSVITTEYQDHALKYIAEAELSQWHGIVVCGGDGLVYEILNGIMSRPDWEKAIKVPVSVIPTGTGNGLAASILQTRDEMITQERLVLSSTYVALKGQAHALDLFTVQTRNASSYAFLGYSFGMIPAIDIGSEKYRKIGQTRIMLGTLSQLMKLKTYKIRLSYLLASEAEVAVAMSKLPHKQSVQSLDSTGENRVGSGVNQARLRHSDSFKHRMSHAESYSGADGCSLHSDSSYEDKHRFSLTDFIDESIMEEMTSDMLHMDIHKHDIKNTERLGPLHENGDINHKLNTAPPSTATSFTTLENQLQPDCDLLVPLSHPVPTNWVVAELEVVTILVCNVSHVASTLCATPLISLDDGLLRLMVMKAPMSRAGVIKSFTAFQDGTSESNNSVEKHWVKAFRVEPLETSGMSTADGELLEKGPVQGQVLPSIAQIIA